MQRSFRTRPGHARYYRCGVQFGPQAVVVDTESLTAEQVARIAADPHLVEVLANADSGADTSAASKTPAPKTPTAKPRAASKTAKATKA